MPDTPSASDVPSTSDTPSTSNTPSVPDTPSTSDTPTTSDASSKSSATVSNSQAEPTTSQAVSQPTQAEPTVHQSLADRLNQQTNLQADSQQPAHQQAGNLPQTGDSELSPIAEVGLMAVLAGTAATGAAKLRKKEF